MLIRDDFHRVSFSLQSDVSSAHEIDLVMYPWQYFRNLVCLFISHSGSIFMMMFDSEVDAELSESSLRSHCASTMLFLIDRTAGRRARGPFWGRFSWLDTTLSSTGQVSRFVLNCLISVNVLRYQGSVHRVGFASSTCGVSQPSDAPRPAVAPPHAIRLK